MSFEGSHSGLRRRTGAVQTLKSIRTFTAVGVVQGDVPVSIQTLFTRESLYVPLTLTLSGGTVTAQWKTVLWANTSCLIALARCQSHITDSQSLIVITNVLTTLFSVWTGEQFTCCSAMISKRWHRTQNWRKFWICLNEPHFVITASERHL